MGKYERRKAEFQDIINRHNDRHAVNTKGVSFATMHVRANFLFAFFTEIAPHNEERNLQSAALLQVLAATMCSSWWRAGPAKELTPGKHKGVLELPAGCCRLGAQGRHGAHTIRARSATRAARRAYCAESERPVGPLAALMHMCLWRALSKATSSSVPSSQWRWRSDCE